MSSLKINTCFPSLLSQLNEIYHLESISYPEDEAATYEKLKYRLTYAPDCFMSWWLDSNDSNELTENNSNNDDNDKNDNNDNSKLKYSNCSKNSIIGFICGTKHSDPFVSHHSMQIHESNSSTLHIHSVVVHPKYRRRGLAKIFLLEYIENLKKKRDRLNSTSDITFNKESEKNVSNLDERVINTNERSNLPVSRIVLMCKDNLITLYESVGFILKGESSCVHGLEKWYDMYLDL